MYRNTSDKDCCPRITTKHSTSNRRTTTLGSKTDADLTWRGKTNYATQYDTRVLSTRHFYTPNYAIRRLICKSDQLSVSVTVQRTRVADNRGKIRAKTRKLSCFIGARSSTTRYVPASSVEWHGCQLMRRGVTSVLQWRAIINGNNKRANYEHS